MNQVRIEFTRTCGGWSRAESLFLTGWLVILFSVLIPGWFFWQEFRLIRVVEQDIIEILSSAEKFFADYNQWPTEFSGEFGDYRYGQSLSNARVMNVLRGLDGAGNPEHSVNPRKVKYLNPTVYVEGDSTGINVQGEYLDPWGTPYQIVLDTDLNNTCYIDRSRYPPQIGHGIVVWSCGPDRRSDTEDDILSWKI